MIRALAVIFALLAGAAGADPLPGLFDVTGVPADDVLNIRSAPASDAAALGSLRPRTRGIEVVALSPDGKWGRIATGEGMGWVAMRFLRAVPAQDPDRVPHPLRCLGTEPFWSLSRDAAGGGLWSTPEGERALVFPQDQVAPGGYLLRAEDEAGRQYHLIITRGVCSDGMSDRQFGLAAQLFLQVRGGNRLYSGCCTLDAR